MQSSRQAIWTANTKKTIDGDVLLVALCYCVSSTHGSLLRLRLTRGPFPSLGGLLVSRDHMHYAICVFKRTARSPCHTLWTKRHIRIVRNTLLFTQVGTRVKGGRSATYEHIGIAHKSKDTRIPIRAYIKECYITYTEVTRGLRTASPADYNSVSKGQGQGQGRKQTTENTNDTCSFS